MQPTEKHIDILTANDLNRLLSSDGGPCVSLYMPTERIGARAQQNRIQFKQVTGKAQEQLAARGVSQDKIQSMMEPLRQWQDGGADTTFWRYQADGLALFLSPDVFAYYRLPVNFEPLAVAGSRFQIKPLLPALAGDARFYLLALSQGGVRLFQGTRFQIGEVSLEGVPKSLAEALQYDEFEKQIQLHGIPTARQGGGDAIYHAQGGANEDSEYKDHIRRFFKQLDTGVCELLANDKSPLVLAGVEYMRGMYREVNHYSGLVDGAIDSNPADLRDSDLHARAWAIVEPIFTHDRNAALDTFRMLAGQGDERATTDLRAIINAAHFSRVDTLFLVKGRRVWGNFVPATGKVKLEEGADSEDLLNAAAAWTLKHGGRVYLLSEADMPAPGDAVAVLRY